LGPRASLERLFAGRGDIFNGSSKAEVAALLRRTLVAIRHYTIFADEIVSRLLLETPMPVWKAPDLEKIS
jgi:hypothetical protein